jgi:hypothetical protein
VLSLSLSLAGKEDVCGHALWRKREGETVREREKQGGRGRDSNREGERCRICPELFIFKRNDRCLGTF